MEGAGTQSTWRGPALRPHGGGGHSVHIGPSTPDCSPQTEPTWRGRALSPHGGGRHSAHMEGAGTQSTWRGRALSPHGGGRHSAHMEGAGTQSTWRGRALSPHRDLIETIEQISAALVNARARVESLAPLAASASDLTFEQQKELLLLQLEHAKTLKSVEIEKQIAVEKLRYQTEQAKLSVEQSRLELLRAGFSGGAASGAQESSSVRPGGGVGACRGGGWSARR
ncbi:unnamed protein product [Gadus morhua 'NCC']